MMDFIIFTNVRFTLHQYNALFNFSCKPFPKKDIKRMSFASSRFDVLVPMSITSQIGRRQKCDIYRFYSIGRCRSPIRMPMSALNGGESSPPILTLLVQHSNPVK